MPRCNCASSGVCSCVIEGDGTTIDVTGAGTAAAPYVITATGSVRNAIIVNDTPTIDMSIIGDGTVSDPIILSADATVAMTDLTDVIDPAGPAPGDVPVWVSGGWQFQAPPTTPPGAVTTNGGITGDGSGPNPIKLAVSGVWGSGTIGGYGPDSTVGWPIYTDSVGQARTAPPLRYNDVLTAFTQAAGWTISSQHFTQIGQVCAYYMNVVRSGAPISGGSAGGTGDIVNVDVATLKAGYPVPVLPAPSGGFTSGEMVQSSIGTTGVIRVTALIPGKAIGTGDGLSFVGTYLARPGG